MITMIFKNDIPKFNKNIIITYAFIRHRCLKFSENSSKNHKIIIY